METCELLANISVEITVRKVTLSHGRLTGVQITNGRIVDPHVKHVTELCSVTIKGQVVVKQG